MQSHVATGAASSQFPQSRRDSSLFDSVSSSPTPFPSAPLCSFSALRRSPICRPGSFSVFTPRAPPRAPSLSLRLPLSTDLTSSSPTMFSFKSIATFALAANIVLGVPTWRRNDIPSLSEWKSKNLESYYKFKMRYRNLGCADIKGSDSYNQCCVPLPKDQSPPKQCTPSSCSAPGSYTPTPTTPAPTPAETYDSSGNSGKDDCEDDNDHSTDYTTDYNTDYSTGDNSDDSDCDETSDGYEPTTASHAPAYTTPHPDTTTPEPAHTTPPPETTTEPAPEPTTTTANSGNNDDNGNSGNDDNNGEGYTGGFATFYNVEDGTEGACGGFHQNSDYVAAMDTRTYGDDTVKSSVCGRRVHITNNNNGQSVEVTIVDACPTCENANSIDLSPSAFEQIAPKKDGMVPITWYYIG